MSNSIQVLSGATVAALGGLSPQALDRPYSELLAETDGGGSLVTFATTFVEDIELSVAGSQAESDRKNSLRMLEVLPELTGLLATDQRLWVTLAFNQFRDYMQARHFSVGNESSKKAKNYTIKYFINSSRNLVRDHGISRLWWMGHFARQLDADNPERVLAVFLKTVDNASQFWGRPSISASQNLARAIYDVLVGENYADARTKDAFSAFMIDIDKIAGRRILAYLEPEELHPEIRKLYLKHLAQE